MPTISGGCHRGLVHFEADVAAEAVLLDCDCSICAMTGYLHLIVPATAFRLIEGKAGTSTYRFGSGKARHIFRKQCGIKSFYRPRSHPDGVSINWRCVEDRAGLEPAVQPFDGRNREAGKAALG